MKRLLILLAAATLACTAAAAETPSTVPVVALSASATTSVPNDRMFAWLRVEVDHADPARAAADVNTRMAKALARARATAGVEAQTSGYSSYQFTEKGQPTRWRVSQSLTLEGADFATMASLLTRLQADDGLVMSGMNFSVSADARHKAEDALTQQAIKAWQARAQNAAKSFGFDAWRMGRVAIQSGEPPMRPQPIMRMAASSMGGGAPVSVEAGYTDVTISVSGDAVLEGKR